MEDVIPKTLVGAAREFWPYFAPAWLFPLAFLIFGHTGLLSQATFILVVTPVFFFAFIRASLPWLRRKVRYWHAVFWSVLVPFIIWCCAVFGSGLLLGNWGQA
jgi:hypothetical protein